MEQQKKKPAGTLNPEKKEEVEKSGDGGAKAEGENRIMDKKKAEEMTGGYLKENFPDLMDDPNFSHQREQIYLMFREGLPESFISLVLKDAVKKDESTLDLIRLTCLLGGEDLALSFLKRDTLPLVEVKEKLQDQIACEKISKLQGIEKLAAETMMMRKSFERQIAFLEKEQENAKKYADELIQRENEAAQEQKLTLIEKSDAEKAQLQTKIDWEKDAHQNEKGWYLEKIEAAEKEISTLQKELENKREKERELNREIEALKENASAPEPPNFFSGWNFARKKSEDKRRESKRREYIASVLSNKDFSREQLTIICHAIKSGMGIKKLEQLCTPELAPMNMQLLENFFLQSELDIEENKKDG